VYLFSEDVAGRSVFICPCITTLEITKFRANTHADTLSFIIPYLMLIVALDACSSTINTIVNSVHVVIWLVLKVYSIIPLMET
jgi:hypothetical protein